MAVAWSHRPWCARDEGASDPQRFNRIIALASPRGGAFIVEDVHCGRRSVHSRRVIACTAIRAGCGRVGRDATMNQERESNGGREALSYTATYWLLSVCMNVENPRIADETSRCKCSLTGV